MSGELVFVTGAAGFLGTNVVVEALKAGYRVRGSVRKEAQVAQLKSYFSPGFGSKVEFVVVPDITKPGAYDGLLDGAAYVFHVASPLAPPSTDWKGDHIDPAVNGTLTILEAAKRISSIKKAVITGSIIDLIPWPEWPAPGEAVTEDHKYEVDVSPDLDFQVSFVAYRASKLLAAKAAREFFAQQKPQYSIVTLHPTFIYGGHPLQTSAEELSGSRALLWNSLKGQDQQIPILNNVHVADVAQAHVKALNPAITGYQKFILSAEHGRVPDWDQAMQFVKEKYPSEQWGNSPSPVRLDINASKAETVLGMVWRDWRLQIIDTVEPQLELTKEATRI